MTRLTTVCGTAVCRVHTVDSAQCADRQTTQIRDPHLSVRLAPSVLWLLARGAQGTGLARPQSRRVSAYVRPTP
eukprot:6777143-Prymnesium_polylepis.1